MRNVSNLVQQPRLRRGLTGAPCHTGLCCRRLSCTLLSVHLDHLVAVNLVALAAVVCRYSSIALMPITGGFFNWG